MGNNTIKTGRMKPCQKCGTLFYCPPCHDEGGSLHLKKYCRRSCYRADQTFTPERREASFWSKVDKSGGPDACWNWQGAVTAKWGYGCFQMGKNRVLGAHKVAWEYTNGPVPSGLCVLHKCDNRLCCNPAHLFIGSKKDNSEDAVAKKRHAWGERTRRGKLTNEQAREIKRRHIPGKRGAGGGNTKELAAEFGVEPGIVNGITAGRIWRNL